MHCFVAKTLAIKGGAGSAAVAGYAGYQIAPRASRCTVRVDWFSDP
jgi:hypothetical protein